MGANESDISPTITTSAWEFNNYVLEIHRNDDPNEGTE